MSDSLFFSMSVILVLHIKGVNKFTDVTEIMVKKTLTKARFYVQIWLYNIDI